MKVTREDVEKAKSEWQAAYTAADDAAYAAEAAAWDKYMELKREYEDESGE